MPDQDESRAGLLSAFRVRQMQEASLRSRGLVELPWVVVVDVEQLQSVAEHNHLDELRHMLTPGWDSMGLVQPTAA